MRSRDAHSDLRWPLGLAAATLAIRLLYLATVARDPLFASLEHLPDAFFFHQWARDIAARGDWLGGREAFFLGPLYAYFLGLLYSFANPTYTALKVVNALLDAGTALFLFGFARRLGGERVARVAGLMWGLYLPAIFFSALILPVALDLFLVSASFYFLARGGDGRRWLFAAAGAAFGLAALDRPNLIVCALAAIPAFVLYRRKLGARRPVAYFAALVAIVGAATLRNYVVAGDPVLISSQGGLNFYLGNSAEARGVYWDIGETGQGRPEALNRDLAAAVAEKEAGRELTASQVSRWWAGRALAWLGAHPAEAARLYLRKFRLLTNDYEVGLNADFYFPRVVSAFHRVPLPWFGFLLPFAVLGVIASRTNRSFLRAAGLLYAAAYGLSVLAFFVSARYRMPVVPVLVAFAALGFVHLYERWRAWRWRRAAALTALAAAVAVFAAYPVPGMSRTAGFGMGFYRYGKYYYDRGQTEEAVGYLERALSYRPDLRPAYLLLSVAYDQQGETERALETLRRGVAALPEDPAVLFAYGIALLEQDRAAEAVAPLEATTRFAPEDAAAWAHLAEARKESGDLAGAKEASDQLLALAPRDSGAWLRAAEIAFDRGDLRAATTAAERAAALDPTLPSADLLLGSWFFERGDYERAVGYGGKEIAARPRSPAAWSLLALAYERRGQGELAREAYRNYLAYGGARDPDFEKAVAASPP